MDQPDCPTSAEQTSQRLHDLNLQATEQQRRIEEARAREHVGAAGWAQASLLEDIIRAGRQQFAATDVLRQVVWLSGEQIRALPLGGSLEARQEQERTLREVVDSGTQQISAAQALSEVVLEALRAVTETPMHQISAAQLRRVHQRVQEQLSALRLMLEAARSQAGTLEHLNALDQVSAAYSQQVGALATLDAEEELDQLIRTGEEVVGRIAELSHVAGERQVRALENIGSATVRQVAETEASPDQQLQTLERLQHQLDREAQRVRMESGIPGD